MSSVVFLDVKSSSEKLQTLSSTVQRHFLQGDRITIAVQNEEAASFIDQFFWKNPPEGFLPHCIATEATGEQVVIVVGDNNLNNATILINLRTQICTRIEEFACIYELFDRSTPDKEQLSQAKKLSYNQSNQG